MNSLSWWEVGPKNRWEMGGWLPKQVGHGSLRPLPYPLTNTAHLTDNKPSNLSHIELQFQHNVNLPLVQRQHDVHPTK